MVMAYNVSWYESSLLQYSHTLEELSIKSAKCVSVSVWVNNTT